MTCKQNSRKSPKRALTNMLIIVFSLLMVSYFHFRNSISSHISISEGESHYVNLDFPFVYVRSPKEPEQKVITINGKKPGAEYHKFEETLDLEGISHGKIDLEVSLWGVIPLGEVTVNVIPEVKVLPGGQSIGIQVESQGVIVVDYYQVSQNHSPAKEAGVKKGDTIVSVEGETVSDVNHAVKLLEKAAENRNFTIEVKRDEQIKEFSVEALYDSEEEAYRIGIYIRDTAAGVGTLSFYHPETGRFGALGHIIIDSETREPADLSRGHIVNADIVNIKTAQQGEPGEKSGIFLNEYPPLGNIEKNTTYGIFGTIENRDLLEHGHTRPFPVALASEVEKGDAKIMTVLEEQNVETYEAKIKRIASTQHTQDKNMVIKISDPELLAQTGGIIQGMSGSPIIQNGKIVGAVTHVFVNDPRQGYGVFMERMIKEVNLFEDST